MSRPTAVVLLCEDHATAVFLRLYVKQCSITRNIRVNITPSGCGFDWVLQQYPVELKAYRIARSKKSTWLIAAIDADEGTVTRRLRQFSLHQQNAEDKHVREIDIQRDSQSMKSKTIKRLRREAKTNGLNSQVLHPSRCING
jgi:hypothetical protein